MTISVAAHGAAVALLCLYQPPLPELPPVPPPFVRVALVAPPKPAVSPSAPRRKRRTQLEVPPAPPQPKAEQAPAPEAPRLEAEPAPAITLSASLPALTPPPAPAAAPQPKPPVVRAAGFSGPAVQEQSPVREARLNVGSFPGLAERSQGSSGAKAGPSVGTGGFAGAAATSAARPGKATASAGFSRVRAERPEARRLQAEAAPSVKPVEVLSKPKPVYTPEARERRIEGDVTLEVRFGADGRAETLRVVRGLGYGLDEAAAAAVRAMQFRPALRDGAPVDSALLVSVAFRLAY